MADGKDRSLEALERSFIEFSRKVSMSLESIGKELDSIHKRMADGEAASVRTFADLGAFKELVRDDLEELDDRVDDALFTPSHYGPAGDGDGAPTFHFRFSTSTTTTNGETSTSASIGEGAVQIGGYTYFSGGGTISGMDGGTKYVCAVVSLPGGSVTFNAYASTTALNSAQSDMSKYIFPLYKVVDYAVEVDYRPMPNAGCWEIAESVSNGGSSSSSSGGSA